MMATADNMRKLLTVLPAIWLIHTPNASLNF